MFQKNTKEINNQNLSIAKVELNLKEKNQQVIDPNLLKNKCKIKKVKRKTINLQNQEKEEDQNQ
jgi:hypothetical protein